MSAVASRGTKCVSHRGRLVMNLRASRLLHHTVGPCNNVGIMRGTYRRGNIRMSRGMGSVFARCHGARGSNMFSTCARRVHSFHSLNFLANLPSGCTHKHVVNSCHHLTLCNVSQLVRTGRRSLHGVADPVASTHVHLHRRMTRRVGTLGRVGVLNRCCKLSLDHPTAGTRRTIR